MSTEIVKALGIVSKDKSEMSTLEKIMVLAYNPMKINKEILDFLEQLDADNSSVYKQMNLAKEALTRSGNWSDDVDPRFEENKAEFDELMKVVEGQYATRTT